MRDSDVMTITAPKTKYKPVGVENKVVVEPIMPSDAVKIGGVTLILAKPGTLQFDNDDEYKNIKEDVDKRVKKKQVFDGRVRKDLMKDLDKAELKYNDEELETSEGSNTLSVHDSYTGIPTEGIVLSAPCRLSQDSFGEDYDRPVQIKAGDHVYFGHNFCQEHKKFEDGNYVGSYELLIAKKGDKGIEMIGDNCFCIPVMESEEDIRTKSGIYVKPEPGKKLMRGILTHIGSVKEKEKWFWKGELKEGDEIVYALNSDIPVKIDGMSYIRLKMEDIIAVVLPGEKFSMRGKYIMIQPDPKPERHGKIILGGHVKSISGQVIHYSYWFFYFSEEKPYGRIFYASSGAMKFNFQGIDFAFIHTDYCYGHLPN